MKNSITIAGSLVFLLVLLQAACCVGQESGTEAAQGTAQVSAGEAKEPVVLTYGMARELVMRELGNPAFESIIRSLQRARLVYSDGTRLVFDRESLVLVKTVVPAKMDGEDFATAEACDKELKIDSRLLAAQPQLSEPAEEHRLIRGQSFFFAPGGPVTMNNGIQFSPVSGCFLGPVAGQLRAWQPGASLHPKAGDPLSRMLLRIKSDVCHVCP